MGKPARNLELDVHLIRHEAAILCIERFAADEEVPLPGNGHWRCLCTSSRGKQRERNNRSQDAASSQQSFHHPFRVRDRSSAQRATFNRAAPQRPAANLLQADVEHLRLVVHERTESFFQHARVAVQPLGVEPALFLADVYDMISLGSNVCSNRLRPRL